MGPACQAQEAIATGLGMGRLKINTDTCSDGKIFYRKYEGCNQVANGQDRGNGI